jgi:CheY-like chemotaxis protein
MASIAEPLSAPAPVRALVVDDYEDNLTSTAALLQLYGFRVHTARDGASALALALREPLDVVLLDLALPQLDGYEVARALRASIPSETPLLVAISGYGREEDVVRCAEIGFDLHLLKPVQPAMLGHLAMLLERGQAAFDSARQLALQHSTELVALFREQLRMAKTYLHLAEREQGWEEKARLLARAAALCARVAARVRLEPRYQLELAEEIAALHAAIEAGARS